MALAGKFGMVWVEGELSNLSIPASGHWYFTLKDAASQVRCALFRNSGRLLGFQPRNGMHVLVRAQVSLYEPRGDYQLVIDYMEETGDGALRRAYEALRQRLDAEGLFDPARKKSIPRFPGCIGIVTSPSGAAIRDILTVLARRFPVARVIVFPTKVQGSDAPGDIARALERADRSGWCDVILLARGGGSLEDLFAFNDEKLARTITACRTPVVTGIGHEVDFTIADFVADLRAPTPSAAAEAVTPDLADLLQCFDRLSSRLNRSMRRILERLEQKADFLDRRLQQAHPFQRLEIRARQWRELDRRLRHACALRLDRNRQRLRELEMRLERREPRQRIAYLQKHLQALQQRMSALIAHYLERRAGKLRSLGWRLDTVNPLATLARGYAIALRARDHTVLRSYRDIRPGEAMQILLAEGRIVSRVERVEPPPPGRDPASLDSAEDGR
jgi:exodeoxyribonuclease VII large subunit